jgi:hypothetical protein
MKPDARYVDRQVHDNCRMMAAQPHSGATVKSFLAGALLMFGTHTTYALDLLVPAYFYPANTGAASWQALASAAPTVGITAILNPDNGPGATLDSNYASVVSNLKAAGGRVIGYVYTGYGARSASTVKADIDRFYSLYGVDGIFIDEVSNLEHDLDYYIALRDHIKGGYAKNFIVSNPGTQTPGAYLATADVLVTFESPLAEYTAYVADAWTAGQDRSRFAHLVYDVPGSTAMLSVIDTAISHNVGHVYVTDDRGANPWDTLPSYWAAETARVAAVPEPSSWAALIAGLGFIATRLRKRTSDPQ